MIRRRVASLVVLALLTVACGSGDDGARLPDVDITPLHGGDPVSLADIDGPAVVNLWATTCPPCVREIPEFEAVHRERGDEVEFVGISIGDDAPRAAEFIEDLGATYDQYLDPQGFVVTELQTTAMPVTLVIDADGVISTRHLGALDREGLIEAIDLALG